MVSEDLTRELTPRNRAVLQAVVETYIDDAAPVSSGGALKRLLDLQLSPATIRTVMAELEALGLLHQPHTSAGRVPTQKGFRTYLDGLGVLRLRPRDRSRLERETQNLDPNTFNEQLAHTLAGLSGQVAVVAIPRLLGSRFREIGLVTVDKRHLVVVFVSPTGVVQQKLVEVDFDLDGMELQRIQNFLNELLAQKTLSEVRAQLQDELRGHELEADLLRWRALEICQRFFPEQSTDVDLLVEGTAQLADKPEYEDIGKLRELLHTIENKKTLLRVLDRVFDNAGVKVILASENSLETDVDLSYVGGRWTGASGQATIGLLGPTRMDYSRLVPMVDYATALFGKYWSKQ